MNILSELSILGDTKQKIAIPGIYWLLRLEFLRFLINDRVCVFRYTHMFGYIILNFPGKYYFNRNPYVYIYWYNIKSSSTEIVLKSYLLPLLREK